MIDCLIFGAFFLVFLYTARLVLYWAKDVVDTNWQQGISVVTK